MPTIPGGNERLGLMETQVPGANLAEGGQQYRALEGFGNQMVSMGAEIQEKRKKAEDSSYAFNKKMEDLKAISEKEDELKKSTPVDGNGYYSAYEKFTKERYEKNLLDAPSEEAREMYRREAEPLLLRTSVDAKGYENKLKADYWKNSITEKSSETAARYIQNPNYRDAPMIMQGFDDQIDKNTDVLYSAAEKEELKKSLRAEQGEAIMQGLFLQEKRYGEGLGLLKKDDPAIKDLKPDAKAKWTKAFMGQKKEREELSKAEINRQIKDMSVRIMSPTGATESEIDALIQKLPTTGMDKNELARATHELNVAKIASGAIRNSVRQNFSDLSQNLTEAEASIDAYTKKQGLGDYEAQVYKNQVRSQLGQMTKMREDDAANFISQYIPEKQNLLAQTQSSDPNISQTASDQLVKYQKYLGIKNVQLMTDDQAFNIASSISELPTSDAAATRILQLQNQYGENFSYVRDQLISTKKISSDIFVSSFMSDKKSKASVISNARSNTALLEHFKGMDKSTKEQLIQQTKLQTKEFSQSLIDASFDNKGLETSQMFQKAIQKEAISLMSQDSSMSAKDAVSAAKKTIWDNNFTMVSSKNAPIVVPKVLSNGAQTNTGAIEKYLYTHSFAPKIAETFGVSVPPAIKTQFPELGADELKSRWLSEIESNSKWISNTSQTGAKLVIKGRSGSYLPVLAGNGEPIEVDFFEMQSTKGIMQTRQTLIPNPVIGKIERGI